MIFRTSGILASILVMASLAAAQAYTFTYQGKLLDGGVPANGPYDIKIVQLEDIAQETGAETIIENVQVTNGIFTVTFSTGALFLIEQRLRFIEIAVRPGSSEGPFVTLSPRQPVNSVPYAGRAASAAEANYSVRASAADAATMADFATSSGTITSVLPIEKGGTGGTTASTARTNLGLGSLSTVTPSGTANPSSFLRGDNAWARPPLVFLATVWRRSSPITVTSYYHPNGMGPTTGSRDHNLMRIPHACTLGSFKATASRTGFGARTFTVVLARGAVVSNTDMSISMSGVEGTSSVTVPLLADDRILILDEEQVANPVDVFFYFSLVCE